MTEELTEEQKLEVLRVPAIRTPATLADAQMIHAMLTAKTCADCRCVASLDIAHYRSVFDRMMQKQGYICITGVSEDRIAKMRDAVARQSIVCAWDPVAYHNPDIEKHPLLPKLWVRRDQLHEAHLLFPPEDAKEKR